MAKTMIKISDNENGTIVLKRDVFSSIAFISAQEDNGVVLENSTFKNSVNCKIENDKLSIAIDLKVRYGQHVQKTCAKVQDKVHKAILDMTGISCDEVDVNVIGFNFNAQ